MATASTSMVDRICATPMKRRRSQTLSSYAYDRVRGADKPAAPVGLVIYNHARGKKKWEGSTPDACPPAGHLTSCLATPI